MSGTGLGRYGVRPRTVLRTPTRNREGDVICPECGIPIHDSKGSHLISTKVLVNSELAHVAGNEVPTHGWVCERHVYPLVVPFSIGDHDASAFVDGWIGLRAQFADEEIRYIPVPAREVDL